MPGDTISATTRAFLDRFDASTRDPAQVPLDDIFHATFLALDPTSVHAVSPAMLAKALPARRAMFADAGVTSVVRTAARETPLDELHRLVAVEWRAERGALPPIALSATFILRTEGDRAPRVVVYLNHRDIAAVLRGATP